MGKWAILVLLLSTREVGGLCQAALAKLVYLPNNSLFS
jgi:hypothetical protein